MKIFLSTLKFTNNFKVYKKKLSRRKKYQELCVKKLSKFPAGQIMTILPKFFEIRIYIYKDFCFQRQQLLFEIVTAQLKKNIQIFDTSQNNCAMCMLPLRFFQLKCFLGSKFVQLIAKAHLVFFFVLCMCLFVPYFQFLRHLLRKLF